MLFYSALNSEKKLMIKKFLPIMSRTFSNDLFALKKSSILHIENLTIPEMFFGNQAFNEHSCD